jgi:hypothetical protein
VGDAFDFVAPSSCDGAINWFTSFGYHRDDRVNERMLHRAFESLRPGGKLALEYLSVPRVLAQFRETQVERHTVASGGELFLVNETELDFVSGMFDSNWTFLHPDGSRETRHVENRAYMPRELAQLFDRAGFVAIEICGASGEPFDRASRRCVVIGQKPA